MLQVERFFRQCQILLRHCCRFWQQRCRFRQQCRTKFRPFNKVERNWIIIITCSICFDFVERNERTKFYNRIVRHCCRLWQQSRTLLRPSRTLLRHCCLPVVALPRHCCWCGRGFTLSAPETCFAASSAVVRNSMPATVRLESLTVTTFARKWPKGLRPLHTSATEVKRTSSDLRTASSVLSSPLCRGNVTHLLPRP